MCVIKKFHIMYLCNIVLFKRHVETHVCTIDKLTVRIVITIMRQEVAFLGTLTGNNIFGELDAIPVHHPHLILININIMF